MNAANRTQGRAAVAGFAEQPALEHHELEHRPQVVVSGNGCARSALSGTGREGGTGRKRDWP